MTENQDNAGEVVASAVRVALIAAGQLAEHAARRREADLRDAERDSAARAATLQSQLAVERELALRSVRDVVQRGDAATVEEVVRAWEQARSWNDPIMATEQVLLEHRIREGFGVDPDGLASRGIRGSQVTATALVDRDVELQAVDSRHRGAMQSQVTALQAELLDVTSHEEAVTACSLAAESHPTPATQAIHQPRGVVASRPRKRTGSKVVLVQGPDR